MSLNKLRLKRTMIFRARYNKNMQFPDLQTETIQE